MPRPARGPASSLIGDRHYPVELTVVPVTLPPLPLAVWAYDDPRELAWAAGGAGDPPRAAPSAAELACIDDVPQPRRAALARPPARLVASSPRECSRASATSPWSSTPIRSARATRSARWIEATRGTGSVPFAIPIDEPRTPEARAKVRRARRGRARRGRWSKHVPVRRHRRAAPRVRRPRRSLHPARTPPRRRSLPALDLQRRAARARARWCSMRVTPGTRTWGWIAWRWKIPIWYVWDALYWHDRHNRKGAAAARPRVLARRCDQLRRRRGPRQPRRRARAPRARRLPARRCASPRSAAAARIARSSSSPPRAIRGPPPSSRRRWCRARSATHRRPATHRGRPTRPRGNRRAARS